MVTVNNKLINIGFSEYYRMIREEYGDNPKDNAYL